jgi:type IV secretory pathway VirD2 relaxase
MRWRAQEIATRELGPRTELEVARERSKELTQDGFTLVDRTLERHVSRQGPVEPGNSRWGSGRKGRLSDGGPA